MAGGREVRANRLSKLTYYGMSYQHPCGKAQKTTGKEKKKKTIKLKHEN